jgi:hypothetical protein
MCDVTQSFALIRCEWTGEYCQAQSHLTSNSGCGYVAVPCRLKCDLKQQPLLRKDVAEHEAKHCPNRALGCAHCSQPFASAELKAHEAACPEAPVLCPFSVPYNPPAGAAVIGAGAGGQCKSVGLRRKTLAAHLANDCLQVVRACPVAGYGCTFVAAREALDAHVISAAPAHVVLLINRIGALEQRVQALESRPAAAPAPAAAAGLRLEKEDVKDLKDVKDVKAGVLSPRKMDAPAQGFALEAAFATPGGEAV